MPKLNILLSMHECESQKVKICIFPSKATSFVVFTETISDLFQMNGSTFYVKKNVFPYNDFYNNDTMMSLKRLSGVGYCHHSLKLPPP